MSPLMATSSSTAALKIESRAWWLMPASRSGPPKHGSPPHPADQHAAAKHWSATPKASCGNGRTATVATLGIPRQDDGCRTGATCLPAIWAAPRLRQPLGRTDQRRGGAAAGRLLACDGSRRRGSSWATRPPTPTASNRPLESVAARVGVSRSDLVPNGSPGAMRRSFTPSSSGTGARA